MRFRHFVALVSFDMFRALFGVQSVWGSFHSRIESVFGKSVNAYVHYMWALEIENDGDEKNNQNATAASAKQSRTISGGSDSKRNLIPEFAAT